MRGLGLASVGKGDAVAHLRPTSDRVRESIFNLLQNGGYGDPVDGARVLDLFAGTGALGLEALSRGAESCVFVDSGRVAGRLLAENIERARVSDVVRIIARDAQRLGAHSGDLATLVFLDPPYGKGLGARALEVVAKSGWLAERTLVVWEEASEQDAPDGFTKLDARRYGDTWVTMLEYDG
ncbi:Ribosomal RNA small subunit methyltransferase D [Boseongicola aestuarii]|uniref:Ribosomal RNA small subunit methyltransferase D n=2 Tax=Boseongicola aestuarii TaxID=1470561 RepID=A0A238J006_9RHOB|nr:Ribosomal RNA small subunit methyltransferase D [Boseongicola aestuarii]